MIIVLRRFPLIQFPTALLSLALSLTVMAEDAPSPVKGLIVPATVYTDSLQDEAAKGHIGAAYMGGGKPLSFAIAKKPRHGVATIANSAKDEWVYIPEKGFVGNDDFQVSTTDNKSMKTTRVVAMVNYAAANRILYVSVRKGNDSNPGTEGLPFASIQAASNITKPGDTVLIEDGTYEQTSAEAVVDIERSGSPGAVITYKSFPGAHPKLFAKTAWNHVLITASYIRVQDLEIAGNAQNVSIENAAKVEERFESGVGLTFGPETSFAQTNGISIRPANQKAPLAERIYPRHIEIIGNKIHDVQGGGISSQWSDYLTINGNQIQNVAIRAMYATSGISILGSQDTDDRNPAYKMSVQDNLVVGARTYVKWAAVKHMSDGNGIILDSNRNAQDKGEPYRGKYLIANNVVIGSGGAGIQVFSTDNADVVFNTVYNNSLTPGLEYGQIWVHASSNLRVENNILVAGDNAKINQLFADNTNVVYDYNIYFGGRTPEMFGPHDIIGDPRFVNLAAQDLRLDPSSPAVASGSNAFSVSRDFQGDSRPASRPPDRGAFQLQAIRANFHQQ